MMAHPLALQLRNLQSLVEIGVDKNTTVVFPAPLMSTIAELGSFLATEQAAATRALPPAATRTGRRRRPAEPPIQRHKDAVTLRIPCRGLAPQNGHKTRPRGDPRDERQTEHRSNPRRMGRRLVLERRHRAPAGRRLPRHRAPVPVDRAGRRRRPAAPGAGPPGRPRHRRRALLRRPGHDRPGHGRAERRRPGLHRRVRPGPGRIARRAAVPGTGDPGAGAPDHRPAGLRLAARRRLRPALRRRRRPGPGQGDVRRAAAAGHVRLRRT